MIVRAWNKELTHYEEIDVCIECKRCGVEFEDDLMYVNCPSCRQEIRENREKRKNAKKSC